MLRAALLLLLLQPDATGDVQFFSLPDPNPDPGIAWYILNAFFLAGVGIAVMVGLGLLFGSFRLWLVDRFPTNRFNGAPEDDVSVTFRLTRRSDTEP